MTLIPASLGLAALLFALTPLSAAVAQTETPKVTLDVLDGWTTQAGSRMAALRIRMSPGWKTYWRAPGETGVPPVFSWAGSQNLKAVRVHWPRPHVYDTYGLRTIGYDGELVLPVELFPESDGAPIRLAGEMGLGVCKEICLPMTLDIASAAIDGSGVIRAALARQPDRGRAAGAGPVICALEPIQDGMRLTATIPLPDQGPPEIVVLEPGRRDVWVSQTETSRTGGQLTASADLVPPEAAPFAFDRSKLRVTVLGRENAVELQGCSAD